MARKKTERKARKSEDTESSPKIFTDRTDFIIGLVLLVAAIYIIIAMCSFISTGDADQSILENLRPGEWLNNDNEFQNYCGSWGAIIGYTFISRDFGFPAFLIPAFIILAGLRLMKVSRVNLWKWFFGMAIVMIWSSITLAKFLAPFTPDLIFSPGGDHGLFIVQKLENVIGAPGLVILLLLIAIVFMTFITQETITFIRKCLNPRHYLNNVDFSISCHYDKQTDNSEPDSGETAEDAAGDTTDSTADNAEEKKEEEIIASDIDQALSPEEEAKLHGYSSNGKTEDTVAQEPVAQEPADNETPDETSDDGKTLLQKQREARLAAAEKEASQKIGMDVAIAHEEDKATGSTVDNQPDISTPINPREPFTNYHFPTLDLLKKYDDDSESLINEEEQIANKNRIIEVLGNYGVKIKTIRATVGPTITLYEIQPAEGVRISKIKSLEDDIALSLAAIGIRIIAPIPGRGTIGIEVPNAHPHIVSMESILNSRKFQESKMALPVALGKTITNEVFMIDLTKMPHLLVAGATGQGKSVGLNAIITSLLYKKHPNELKLVLIDPKKVEFSIYSKIAPHFMAVVDEDDEPIITDVTKVVRTLNSLCKLMDHRYDMLKLAGVRNIKEYNQKFVNHRLDLTKGHEFMPYIVVIIDEFGDLIMTAGKEIEQPIARIAQLARAVGIHMVIATQRPTTNIITGTIKANFPGRIAFKVSAGIDSKTILDRPGAQQLIGRGDMLYLNGSEPVRVQCAFVDTPEVERINAYIAAQPGPVEPLILPEPDEPGSSDGGSAIEAKSLDPYFEEAAHAVVLSQQGSTSMIQRRFSIGFNRAGRVMDQLENAGIVGPSRGAKPREVLVQDESQLNAIIARMHG